jgi:predicted dehydrogenase
MLCLKPSRALFSSALVASSGRRSEFGMVLNSIYKGGGVANNVMRSFSSKEDVVRWGILSAGAISSDFAKAIAITEGAQAKAVAARDGDRAADFAKKHDVERSYGSYDKLLCDPDIDVVYVGSVADQHFKLATKSLLAGKPTVVEKPLTLTHKHSEMLVQLARKTDTFLMYVL